MQRTKFKDNQQKTESLALSHLDQARKLAWSFHKITGVDIDDCMGQAFLWLAKAVKDWQPEKSSFSTTAHTYIQTELKTILYNFKKHTVTDMSEEPLSFFPTAETIFEFKDLVDNFSQEAKEVANIIFSGPSDILEIAKDSSPCKTRVAIKKYLRNLNH